MTLSERFGGLILDRNTGRVVGTKLASVTGHLLLLYSSVTTIINMVLLVNSG